MDAPTNNQLASAISGEQSTPPKRKLDTPQSSTSKTNSPRAKNSSESQDHSRSSAKKDWDKIIFSSPFRRLAGKTQVFPLVTNDNVHTRATHSLEVASVGLTLGRMVSKLQPITFKDSTDSTSSTSERRDDYTSLLEYYVGAACLLHDIGNPPFGHSGEDALREWWSDWSSSPPQFTSINKLLGYNMDEIVKYLKFGVFRDFEMFEGNAFGYRILNSRLLKLTYPSHCAYMKYPCPAFALQLGDDGKLGPYKKNGIFVADLLTYVKSAQRGGMGCLDQPFCWKRSPLTYLMEAADDICYSVVDIEDACRMGVVSIENAIRVLESASGPVKLLFPEPTEETTEETTEEQKKEQKKDQKDQTKRRSNQERLVANTEKLSQLRATAISQYVDQAYQEFERRINDNSLGKDSTPLLDIMDNPDVLETSLSIYTHSSVVEIEVAGYAVIKDLMDKFVNACLRCINFKESKCTMAKGGSYFKFFQVLPIEVQVLISDLVEQSDDIVSKTAKWMKENKIDCIQKFWMKAQEDVDGTQQKNSQANKCPDPVVVLLWLELKESDVEQKKKIVISLYLIYYIILEVSSYVSGMTDDYASKLYQKFRGQFL